jgi:hypothetical protein
MMRILIMVAGLASMLTSAQWAAAQDLASQIVGVWKMTSYARKDLETGKTSATFGERPVGYYHYTRGGHFVSYYVAQDRKINAKAELTDAESLDAFKTLSAASGTYKTEGDKIIMLLEAAHVPSWAGATRTNQAQVAGNKLTLTSAPFKSRRDGKEIVVVSTWERVE